MRTLDQIAIERGTDKSSKGHSYCQYYDMFFSSLRNEQIRLLEIGVDEGNSLLMWAEYFSQGNIIGVDIRDGYEYLHTDRISTAVVNQSAKGELILFSELYSSFDIIVDDGSHQSNDQILTLETLFPYLKPNGFYCVEDVLCDYDERWNKGRSSIEYFKTLISNVNMSGNIPNSHICANKQEAVKKYSGSYLDLNIEWIFNSCGLVIIKKL